MTRLKMKFIIYHMPAPNYLKTAMSCPSWLWYFPKVIFVVVYEPVFSSFCFCFHFSFFSNLCIAERNKNKIFWKFSAIYFQVAKTFVDIFPSCGLFESITDSSKRESFFTLSKIWSSLSGIEEALSDGLLKSYDIFLHLKRQKMTNDKMTNYSI